MVLIVKNRKLLILICLALPQTKIRNILTKQFNKGLLQYGASYQTNIEQQLESLFQSFLAQCVGNF